MRALAWLVPLALLIPGCVTEETPAAVPEDPVPAATNDSRVFIHTAPSASASGGASASATANGTSASASLTTGNATDVPVASTAVVDPLIPKILARTLEFGASEPTMGVTSDGTLFYVADIQIPGSPVGTSGVIRSIDGGATWEIVSTPLSSHATLDPYLFVDPDTDRVYSDQLYVGCSWLSWSDDKGETWTTNPVACGLPVNDHQKLASGVLRGPVPTTLPTYGKVLYYGYNSIAAGSRVSMSYDGGLTWPVNTEVVPAAEATCNGGLHGNIVTSPDGIVYIPKRHCDGFILAKSTDSGLTWNRKIVGADAGGSECRKNADLAVDRQGNVYGAWPGKDNQMYLSTSMDQGETWLAKSLVASPAQVNMTTMPALVAGDAGRIALVYYGTSDGARGPDEVDESAVWHLYVTYSLNALDPEPTFVTIQATEDPVQIGPVSTNSACAAPAGSRNLLDFLDAVIGADGRLYVSYTDGCVGKCVAQPEMERSRSAMAGFALLNSGPSLLTDVGLLGTLIELTEEG